MSLVRLKRSVIFSASRRRYRSCLPLVNLSADGTSAKSRWYGFNMLGGGATARWDSGTFENEYVKDNGPTAG